MRKIIVLLIVVFLSIPLYSQQLNDYEKTKSALVRMTIMYDEVSRQKSLMNDIFENLIRDLKSIEKPQPELKKILDKYKIK